MCRIKEIIRALGPFFVRNAARILLICLLAAAGCAGTKDAVTPPAPNAPPERQGISGYISSKDAANASVPKVAGGATGDKAGQPSDDIKEVKIKEFVLSKGDQISISVFQHDELTRKVKIPPDGKFYFPMVGEIEASGKSMSEVREIIKKGLSGNKEQPLLPGDEIAISVYRQPEMTRKVVVPSDGYIAMPFMGDVKAEGRTRMQLQGDIAAGLSKYVKSPQVYVDITKSANSKRIADAQVGIEVVDFTGQKILVLGEVRNPGVYIADGNMSVVEAISRASGFTLDAKQDDVYLVRAGRANKRDIVRLNIADALNNGDLEQNPNVMAGDTIYVSRTFISNVDRFFDHLAKIVSPLINIESGYYTGQQIETHFKGSTAVIR